MSRPNIGASGGISLADQGPAAVAGVGALLSASPAMTELLLRNNMDVGVLRNHGPLFPDEHVFIERSVIEPARERLQLLSILEGLGLTVSLPNPLGHTEFEWYVEGDMTPARRAMTPTARSEYDLMDRDPRKIPIHCTFKDFQFGIRELMASRNFGRPLDVSHARVASRKVSDSVVDSLINGAGVVVSGNEAYGLLTHPDVNSHTFSDGDAWDDPAKSGEDILRDILDMIGFLEDDNMFGPYILLVNKTYMNALRQDFKAATDKPLLSRITEINDGLGRPIRVLTVDQMPADTVVLFQATSDVVQVIMGDLAGASRGEEGGSPILTIYWPAHGELILNWKVLSIIVPLIRSTGTGQSGIVVGTPT